MNPKCTLLLLLSWLACLPVFSQVTADFFAYPRENCNPPYEVTFQNLSQGDTAWLWDFGDGNSSFFPDPIHLYATVDTFTIRLIAYGPAGTDTVVKEDYIVTLPSLPAPVLAKTRDTVLCGRGTTLRASGLHELVWYDFANQEVARGDSLHIPILSSNVSYKVSSEELGPSQKVGPAADTTIGPYGAYSNATRGLQFDVYRPIVLKSVLVYANSSGLRRIELRDTFGVTLKIIEIYIFAGAQRVPLDLKLLPGNYQLVGTGLDLYSNSVGSGNPAAYPYELTDYLTITKPRGVVTDYYFFYDWEIAPYCQSPFAQVDIVVEEIPKPVFSSDTVVVDCGYEGLIRASADSAYEIRWFDRSGVQISTGDSLYLPFIDSSETFFAKNSYESPVFRLGPRHPDSLGGKSIFGGNFYTSIEFEVFAPIELQSFWVYASRSFGRSFLVKRGNNLLKTINYYVSAGPERIDLDIKLMPGTYTISGANQELYRNVNVPVDYPYRINNLISINKSSQGNGNYNFYYDWRLRALCESELDSVRFQVEGLDPPVLNKFADTLFCGDSTHFIATSPESVHWYDQQDSSLVHIGKELNLPSVSEDKSYFVTAEYERPEIQVGHVNSIGFSSNDNEGLIFTVHKDVLIKSVLVRPSGTRTRTFYLKELFGDTLKTFSFYVFSNTGSGTQRLPLNIELPPGEYSLSGSNLGLSRTETSVNFPYSLPGLIDITGNTAWRARYSYFFDWRVTTVCKSASVQVDVKVNERESPVIQGDTISSFCGQATELIAQAAGNVHWYNKNGYEVGRGDTLKIPFATASNTYFARQKVNNQYFRLGLASPGSTGFRTHYNTADERGIAFTAYTDIILRSVLVDTDSGRIRHLVIRKADGTIYQMRDVFIPMGVSRIKLDVMLPRGSYFIGGTLLDLYGGYADLDPIVRYPYPYMIQEIASIDAAVVYTSPYSYLRYGVFYHFFDWEIETLCASEADSVYLQVDPFTAKPTVTPASFTLDCADSVLCYATGREVLWFDQQGNVISDKDTLIRDRVASPTTFYCQNIVESPSVFDGLRYNSSWDGGFLRTNGYTYLNFDVLADVNLLSFYAYADNAGMRTIFLNDSSGLPLDTFEIFFPAGRNRIPLDIQFSAGSYQIGGANLGLAFHDQEVRYPYDIGGLISITGNSADSAAYYFFFEWEVRTSCISDPVAVPVNFMPVPPPIPVQDTLQLMCNAIDTLLASGRDQVLWYDQNAHLITQGDSLFIRSLQDSTTFFAVNQTADRIFQGGPPDSTAGMYSLSSQNGLIFDVHQDVSLRSVKVYAQSAGNRLFEYRDALGNVIDSLTVFVPVGESRVYLDFLLQVGNDFELAVNGWVDLYRDTAHANYPYTIGSLVSLTKAKSSQPLAHYNYFYDWEVGDYGCQSVAVPVFVEVAPFVSMTTISGTDSICYEQQATFSSSTTSGKWLDPKGNLLAISDSLKTFSLTSGGGYAFIGESDELTQSLGPQHVNVLGTGALDSTSSDAFLHFTVDAPLRLNSVSVQTDTAGIREIVLLDGKGSLLQSMQKFIPADTSRLYLGLELQPGNYAIGGDSLYLYRNDSGASYPYLIPGLISITGTNKDSSAYYYFYDWEVQDIPCQGDTVYFDLEVLPQILPAFTFSQIHDSLIFTNSSTPTNANWLWDFGDGDSSFLPNPIHIYADTGHFVVTLTVSNGLCEQQFADSVYIPGSSDGVDKLLLSSFRLFPNPGNGHFIVEARAEGIREMKVEVYDLQGRVLYQSAQERTTHFREEVDLGEVAKGTYMVLLWVDGARIARLYVRQ